MRKTSKQKDHNLWQISPVLGQTSGRDILISFLQSFTGGLGQDVSQGVNIDILVLPKSVRGWEMAIIYTLCVWDSLLAQSVKKPPALQRTSVPFLGGKDLLEKEMETHSSILA